MNRREFNLSLLASGVAWLSKDGFCAPTTGRWSVVRELRHSSDINVEQVDYSPQKQWLASWATDGSINVWNLAKNQNTLLLSRGEGCSLVGFQNQRLLFLQNGQVRQLMYQNGAEEPYNALLTPSALSANEEWWAGLRDGQTPTLWNAKSSKIVSLTAPPAVYRAVPRYFHFSEDSRWLAIAQGVRVVLWQLDKPEDPITLDDQPGDVNCVKLSKDARFVVMGCMGGNLQIYDRQVPRATQNISFKGDVRALSLDPNRHHVLIGCSESNFQLSLLALPNTKKPSPLPAEPERVGNDETWSCWIREDIAVTGHRGGRIQVWKWSRK